MYYRLFYELFGLARTGSTDARQEAWGAASALTCLVMILTILVAKAVEVAVASQMTTDRVAILLALVGIAAQAIHYRLFVHNDRWKDIVDRFTHAGPKGD